MPSVEVANVIEVTQGDDLTLTFTLKKAAGTAYDLTGASVFATVKRAIEDADASALISTTLSSIAPTTGVCLWALVPADTKYLSGIYKYDIQLKDNVGKITTVQSGDFYVKPEVTKRIV
jgi:hypothetical protein